MRASDCDLHVRVVWIHCQRGVQSLTKLLVYGNKSPAELQLLYYFNAANIKMCVKITLPYNNYFSAGQE